MFENLTEKDSEMEIEILTTKKKLTKAIVKQLDPARIVDIKLFLLHKTNEAFYVRDLGAKYPSKVCLFKSNSGKWLTIALREWVISKHTPSKMVCKNMYMHFDCEADCVDWIDNYNELKSRALKNHLII